MFRGRGGGDQLRKLERKREKLKKRQNEKISLLCSCV